ncbi:cytochrome P450 [Gloeopeniophorella convolvens]|nr:cytochrome P450 [Gloeopeniophorella convolvens]
MHSLNTTLPFGHQLLVSALRAIAAAATAFIGACLAYVFWVMAYRRLRSFRSPLRDLPGPAKAHWFKGNFVDVQEPDATRLQEEWIQKYGHVIRYHSGLGSFKLLALDPVAVSHVLQNSHIFQKSEMLRFSLGRVTGRGLLFVEGTQHKKQRKVMVRTHIVSTETQLGFNRYALQNPAFGPVQVRRFTSLFFEKSQELRDIWTNLALKSTRKDGNFRLDAHNWLSKLTLDIIGLAGFGYSFDSLHSSEDANELYAAIRSMMAANTRSYLVMIQLLFPLFRPIPTARSRVLDRAFEVIRRVGTRLIDDKKAAVIAESSTDGSGVVEKQNVQGHDLLSLLIRSNMASDMPETMRMSDSEILSQVPTFLIAGHETTSTAVTWTLFALSCNPAAQTALRAELRACPTDSPSMDELNALSYLEGVIREALRLYAPVSNTQRIAVCDAEIPLQKPFVDRHGVTRASVRVAEGDVVTIPIRALNRATEIWGEDANEFRPERWNDEPTAARALPSVYGHLMTFIAGAHACIGYRFSVVEMKAILFTLVRAFEFSLALPPDDIVRKTMIVGRPVVSSNPAAGPQLPILVRPVNVD